MSSSYRNDARVIINNTKKKIVIKKIKMRRDEKRETGELKEFQ